MNIEELSKAQLILLTILVNFVTAIATAILTVSLLDQAPPYVTQTVNRVVEHTIETVAAAAPAIIQQAPAPSNQDLVTAAIGAAAARSVAIYPSATGTSTPAIAVGTYLAKSRAVATVSQEGLPKEVIIEFTNGSYVPASLAHDSGDIVVYGFADNVSLPKTASPILVPEESLKLGATVLALSSDGFAATGIIARVGTKGIYTTLPDIGAGSAAVDLSGNLIGLGVGSTPGLLMSASKITSLLISTTTTATSTSTR